MNDKDCWEFIQQPDIDGFLINTKTLTPDIKTIIDAVDVH